MLSQGIKSNMSVKN